MYRTCCITTGNSPTSLSVTTLFDTGANPTSFVNRQVAAWIESHQSPQAHGKRKHSPAPLAAVSLAGTSQSSPIYGSVVFNLTFFNEVTRSKFNETLYRLHIPARLAKNVERIFVIIIDSRRTRIRTTFFLKSTQKAVMMPIAKRCASSLDGYADSWNVSKILISN